jgi:predicted small lipoprotein YifL
MSRRLTLFLVLLTLLLTLGCGNKGPLYLPQDGAGSEQADNEKENGS